MVGQNHQKSGVARTKRRPQRKIFGSHCHAATCGQWQVSKPRVSAGARSWHGYLTPTQKNIQSTGGHLPRTNTWRSPNHTAAWRRSVSRCQEFSPPPPRLDHRTVQGCRCPALAVLYQHQLSSSPPAKRARKHKGVITKHCCDGRPSGLAPGRRPASSLGGRNAAPTSKIPVSTKAVVPIMSCHDASALSPNWVTISARAVIRPMLIVNANTQPNRTG